MPHNLEDAALVRDRAQWMLARAALNAAIALIYARALTTGTPRRGRAVGGVVEMSALTLTDYLLARRLRDAGGGGTDAG